VRISATTTLFIALSHSEIELCHYIELYNRKELYLWKHYSIVPDSLDYQSLALSSEKNPTSGYCCAISWSHLL